MSCALDVFKFTCPEVGVSEAQQHPRYADPDDCQFFYVCIDGKIPRRNGCKRGQVFNEVSKNCDWPRNVNEWLVHCQLTITQLVVYNFLEIQSLNYFDNKGKSKRWKCLESHRLHTSYFKDLILIYIAQYSNY